LASLRARLAARAAAQSMVAPLDDEPDPEDTEPQGFTCPLLS
jgi:hypothetical protein